MFLGLPVAILCLAIAFRGLVRPYCPHGRNRRPWMIFRRVHGIWFNSTTCWVLEVRVRFTAHLVIFRGIIAQRRRLDPENLLGCLARFTHRYSGAKTNQHSSSSYLFRWLDVLFRCNFCHTTTYERVIPTAGFEPVSPAQCECPVHLDEHRQSIRCLFNLEDGFQRTDWIVITRTFYHILRPTCFYEVWISVFFGRQFLSQSLLKNIITGEKNKPVIKLFCFLLEPVPGVEPRINPYQGFVLPLAPYGQIVVGASPALGKRSSIYNPL